MCSRFDTPETEKERKKKDWGSGWRMQDNLNQHIKKTDDIFSIIASKNNPPATTNEETEQPSRQSKIKPVFYSHDKENRAIRPRGMATITRRKDEDEEEE